MNAHPTELLDNTVALLKSFSTLVSNELDGDENRVFAHADAFPGKNLATAILNAPHPSIMVAYMGVVRGNIGQNEVIRHKISLFLRAREADEPVSGSHNLMYEIENGEDSLGNKFRSAEIHEECYPIGRDLEFKRIMNLDNNIDIWEAAFQLTELAG